MIIEPNKVVSLTYDLYVEEEGKPELVESTTSEKPLVFLYGAGQMLPKFEEHLSGLPAGSSYEFKLSPQDAYGEYDEEAVTEIPKTIFKKDGVPEAGSIIPLQDSEGNQFQAEVLEIKDDAIVVDLNHPMAGQELHFRGNILSVREASTTELEHKHVHGEGGAH